MSKRNKPLKLEQFCVVIDDEKKVYYPGESFSGNLHVNLREQMIVAGISVSFCGHVKTCWSEGAGEEKKSYTGEEVLFRKTKVMFGNAPTSLEKKTTAGKPHKEGQFDYTFSFTFPQILPSSFESSFGSIRYYVKAQIHKPGIKLDFITKVPLTVIDRIDTTEMYCFTRKEDEILQTIGCFGINSGPVFCKADIDRGCYIPGESIVFNAHVENHSKKTLKGLKSRLDQVVDYFADDGSSHKITRKTLERLKGPKVHPGETFEWRNQSLQIPITEPSIHNCSLINIRYVIVIYADVRCLRNVCLPFEIIIGTIPGHINSVNVSHSYKSIPNAIVVSFNDDQEEICKITHEIEYLPTYPYLETNKDDGLVVEDLT